MVERVIVYFVIFTLAILVWLMTAQNLGAQDLSKVQVDRPVLFINITAESKGVETPGGIDPDDALRLIYNVGVTAHARIAPALKEDVEAIPVISFKGVDVKMAPVVIPKGSTFYDYGTNVRIESYVPPVQRVAPSASLDFVEGQEYVTGCPGFDCQDKSWDVFKIKMVKVEEGFFTDLCDARFEIECQNAKIGTIDLEKCDGDRDEYDCTYKTGQICGGQVTLTMLGPVSCGKRTADDLKVDAIFDNSPLQLETGDTLLFSLFRNSECVRTTKTVYEMMYGSRPCSYKDEKNNTWSDLLGNGLKTFWVLPQ